MGLNTYPNNPFPPSTEQMHRGDNEELQAQIDAIKDGATIDSFGEVETALATKTDNAVIAPEFDAEAGIYSVGDLVMDDGKLYEFTTAHETPGVWNPEEVTEKTVADEIDTLKSGLTNYENQNDLNLEVPNRKNLCNTSDMVSGMPVSSEGAIGNTVVISSSQYTNTYKNAVYVKAGQTYTASWAPNTPSATTFREGVITDSNGVVLEVGITTWVNHQNYYSFTPAHSGYLYVPFDKNTTNYQIEVGSTATAYTPYIPSVESRIESVESGLITLNANRIIRQGIANQTSAITITFAGKGHTRIANMVLMLATQAKVYPPIPIMFTGVDGPNMDITSVVVADNELGITTSGLSITIPSNLCGWGTHLLYKLFPDDNITVSVS